MHLLLITNRYPVDADDAASPFVPYFVDALQRCGVCVDVLTPSYSVHRGVQGREPSRGGAEPLFVHRFESGSGTPVGSWNLANPVNWMRLARFVASGLREGQALCGAQRYDHILALWALPSGHFARVLSRQHGIPYSVWCLGSDIYQWARRPVIRQQIAAILRDAACVFGDGDDLCCRVTEWLNIDCCFLPSFRPLGGSTRPQPSGKTDAPRYLYLGRLHRTKGILELADAFALVHRVLPDARIDYVGHGPDRTVLEAKLADLGLGVAASVVGPSSTSEVAQELAACDFVVIPTKSDSLPLVFSEAVQACRPVIGTNIGDLGTFIRRYGVGLVAESVQLADLAGPMLTMAAAPVFSMDGRSRLLDLMDPSRAAAAFCEHALGTAIGVPPERHSVRLGAPTRP